MLTRRLRRGLKRTLPVVGRFAHVPIQLHSPSVYGGSTGDEGAGEGGRTHQRCFRSHALVEGAISP
jgi:hypothetical protein